MNLRTLLVVSKHNAAPARTLKIGERFAHISYHAKKISIDPYNWEVTAYQHHKYSGLAVKRIDSIRGDFYHTPHNALVAKEK